MELKLFSNIILNFGHQIRIRERFILADNIELEGITIYFTINNLSFMKYEVKRISFPFQPLNKRRSIFITSTNFPDQKRLVSFMISFQPKLKKYFIDENLAWTTISRHSSILGYKTIAWTSVSMRHNGKISAAKFYF